MVAPNDVQFDLEVPSLYLLVICICRKHVWVQFLKGDSCNIKPLLVVPIPKHLIIYKESLILISID